MSQDALFPISRFRAPDGRNKGGRGRCAAGRGRGGGWQRPVLSADRTAGSSPRGTNKGISSQKRASGEQEPDVLLHCACTEITAVLRRDSVALYIDDFQRTQIELGELMIRVGYYFVV